MSTVPADVDGPSDAELIDSVRSGTVSAYASLYERHLGAAHNLARQLTRSTAEADDLVSEAFAKVLDTLRQGRGPDSAFRAYLLTALRHTAYDKTRRDRKLELSDDVSQVSGVNPETVSVPFSDTAVAGLERSLAARAFALLPERWQAVLWHTEIEGESPAQVAPLLGLTPNGVSALAYRAREGLRQAYLQVHLAENTAEKCRSTADRLGAWVRDGLSKREKAQVESHLDECDRCRALAAELTDVNAGLRGIVAPLVLGLGGAAGYLAATKATAGVTLVAAGAVAGSSAGAAGAAAAGAPRQFLGAAVSGVALAVAIAVGLAASPTGQEIPAAAPVPESPAPTAPLAPQSPPPVVPVPPAPAPPAPAQPAPQVATQAPMLPVPEQPQPPPAPVPTPRPGPPSLSAEGPGETIALVPGGDPADVPFTVRNTGGSRSEPVTAVLSLPAGVRAIPSSPTRLTAEPMLRLNGAQRTGTVFCPGGTGTIRCGTSTGLVPGDSVTLLFRVQALPGAGSGRITAAVSAGMTIKVSVSVPVVVAPPLPPPAVDGVSLRAYAELESWIDSLLPWHRKIRVEAKVTNTGTSSRPITVTANAGGLKTSSTVPVTCVDSSTSVRCTTTEPVAPGTRISVVFRTGRGHDHSFDGKPRKINLTASLGTAVAGDAVVIPWIHGSWWQEVPPVPPAPRPPVPTETTVPKPPSTTTTKPTVPPLPSMPAPPSSKPRPVTTVPAPPSKPTQPTVPTVKPPKPSSPPSTNPPKPPKPICDSGSSLIRWLLPC